MFKTPLQTYDVFDPGGQGVRHNSLRKANSKAVIRAIGFNPGVSNAEISRLSGLAPQTVSAILLDLEEEGLIQRGEAIRGKRGQPATPIRLNPNGAISIGVEIGWTHAEAVLLNFHANVLKRQRLTYDYPDAKTIFDWIGTQVDELKASLPPHRRNKILDIGVALPGEIHTGLADLGAPQEQIDLWAEIDVKAAVKAQTSLDVSIFNDGNAGCWSELIALPSPRPANIVYLLASDHLAAGIIGDGALWEGPTGHGADLGSMLVHPEGGGPVEAHHCASLLALRQSIVRPSELYHFDPDWNGEGHEAEVEAWISVSAQAMARVIFNTITVLEKPVVIIDSVLSRAISERLAREVDKSLACLPVKRFAAPTVLAGKNGALASAIGAAELALFRRYF